MNLPSPSSPVWGWPGVFAPVLAVYLLTLNPTIYWGDGAELTTASSVLGVGHPTGYPLFMLLGRLLRCLPLGVLGWRLNLLSALSAALLAYAVYCLALRLLPRVCSWLNGCPLTNALLAGACGWAVALSRDIWYQAGLTEVYLLNAAGIAVTLTLILYAEAPAGRGRNERLYYAAALWTGLFMGNQLLAMCGAAALLAALLNGFFNSPDDAPSDEAPAARGKILIRRLAGCALCGLVGLSVYAYLPTRAAAHPPMNWGDPSSVEQFRWMVRGGDFREQRLLMLQPGHPFTMKTWKAFATYRAQQLLNWTADQFRVIPRLPRPAIKPLAWLLALLAAAGWAIVFLRAPAFFWAAAAAAGLNLVLVLIYNIPDIEGYFFPFALYLHLGAIVTCATICGKVPHKRLPPQVALTFAVACYLLGLGLNAATCNHPSHPDRAYAAENYGREILDAAEPNALIVTNGDNDIYALWYQQIVERRRLDVDVIGSNFLIAQPWYLENLKAQGRISAAPGPCFLQPVLFEAVFQTDRDLMFALRDRFLLPHLRQRPVHLTWYNNWLKLPFESQPLKSLTAPDVLEAPEYIYLPAPELYRLTFPRKDTP